MSSNNWWLYEQLLGIAGVTLEKGSVPLIIANYNGRSYRIYTPTPDEYIVSIDIVDKVRGLGGNVISYASWSEVSSEARKHANGSGVEILPHGALFARFGK
ncbi:hypothetical protein [Nevskia sp.]|uniref:hypothetical protein n=1 Tax=Nevskia sp. TaxID=1929292 RepID=UPI0025F4FA05|nr:hypothetical protein [Nevskia sp.]